MTTNAPLVVVNGQVRQIDSTSKLGPVAGGTATGEVMTQDQFDTNYDQLGPSGSPHFDNAHTTILDLMNDGSSLNNLRIAPEDDRTAHRLLTLSIGDANRSLTISGNAILVGGTMAPTSGKLSQFAATTSAELAGVISDETGSGALVFAGSPALTGTVTMVNATLSGNIVVNGNTTIGDASGDTVTINSAAWTLPVTGGITKTKPAESATAETLEIWKVSDSNSSLVFKNGTSNVSEFAPTIEGAIEAGVISTALAFQGTKGSSDTTNPAVLFLGRYNSGSGNTDIPDTAPLTEFRNRVTTIWQYQIMGSGAIRRPRGTTRETQELQATVTTTDATQTTLATIALTSSYTYIIDAVVVARRTGGSSGTADDGASYQRRATYTTKSGTVTLMGSVLTIGTDAEDQAAWDVTFTISSTNVLLRVTGAANNNITWFAEYSWQRVNS